MRIVLFKDGNFSSWLRGALLVAGALAGWAGLKAEWLPRFVRLLLVLGGFGMMALGGLSSRAHMLGIRPFGESEWRKAKRTYEQDDSK